MAHTIRPAVKHKYAGRTNRRGGDQAAAKHEDYDRHDDEDKGKGQNGCKKQLVGWLLPVQKRGVTKNGRTQCCDGKIGCVN